MPILKIEKLTKKYGKTYALNGLDMEVKKGDIYGFVGPNGAGKTTTLRIISGLLKSDGGDLWLDGVRTTKNILKQKSLIGFVPDFFGVYENLSVIEYLEFFAASYGIYGRAGTVRAREVLEMVELSGKEEQMVDSLSRGIQQRLCLARAMIHKPKLLVLDEPNSGLDPRSRKDFQLLLQRLAREDYTILISSHILSELADLCTSIGVINGGVMVQQGKLENIMLAIDSSNPLRITVLNQVPKALELLRQDPQVSRLSVDENKIAAWFSGSREEEAYLLQTLVENSVVHGVSLDRKSEISLYLTNETYEDGEYLYICISDTGNGFSKEALDAIENDTPIIYHGRHHVGISNIKRRLALMYGERASITCSNMDENYGAVVEVRLPKTE